MSTPVVMPQMGESIAEGTIVRWIKKVGDKVDRDEPLFEISTDKVDAEIPSPVAGVLAEIRVKEGETVSVNSVVGVIGEAGAAAEKPAEKAAAEKPAEAKPGAEKPAAAEKPTAQADGDPQSAAAPRDAARGSSPAPTGVAQGFSPATPARSDVPAPAAAKTDAASSVDERRRQKSSPLVRKIAREHQVDITSINGTGIGGRVTKSDILGHLERAPQGRPAAAGAPPQPSGVPAYHAGERVEIAPMSVMRKKIAEHMVLSRRTSAHVHSVFEVGFARVEQIRQARKAEFERAGAKITYLSFIIKAVVSGLRAVPVVNASVDGEKIVYKKDVNIGIAVALDWGLIVPVIRNADEKNLLGLSRAVADLASRARSKQLKPEEVQGGTFTITNPGVFGALFGMPIINQPQVAILGIGAVEKRPVVVDDAIAIRHMAYLSLGYDHRIIDGAVADEFMSVVKKELEGFEE